MPRFGRRSKINLNSCHPDLQRLFREVVKKYDCSVLDGHRTEGEHEEMRLAIPPVTEVMWEDSKHHYIPSLAADVAPWIDGDVCFEPRQCYHFAGYVLRVAHELGIKIRCGADWDLDNNINDQTFRDIIHFELIKEEL
ncbi:M15 family peptidase [Candidatus Pacearchaeota archaeon]|nr:M15 family peptidase [Candidatus Pacearchaeota archaeon]